jgi:NADPH:quinone reductase-like Zn-dependent oxidoreductase
MLTPFSVHGAASLKLAPGGGDWADLRRALMKAVRLLEYGGQLVFNDVPTPTIARDEILVRIRSTTVNHLDLVEASGAMRQILPIDLPWIPGHEFLAVAAAIYYPSVVERLKVLIALPYG